MYMCMHACMWKQGVVVYIILYVVVVYNTTPIHCTPLRLHPHVMIYIDIL